MADPVEDPKKDEKTLTQDQVNAIMKKEKDKYEAKLAEDAAAKETLLAQISEYQKGSALSDEQKNRFQGELEELRLKGLTDQQKHEEEQVRLKNRLKELEEGNKKEVTEWRTRHDDLLIGTNIRDASNRTAKRPGVRTTEPIVALLKSQTAVEDRNGEKVAVVKNFAFVTKDGKVENKDVLVTEAIDNFYDNPRFRYLFEDERKAGPGTIQGSGDPGTNDPNNPPTDPKLLRQWLKDNRRGA